MVDTYAHPEYVVETDWVAEHLTDSAIRLVESNEDALLYDSGHIPGAVKVDWFSTLQDPLRRDFLSKSAFEELCSRLGISKDTSVVFYGDKSNWFATYALWLFRYYGHEKLKIMNGGRAKWVAEGRPLTKDPADYQRTSYRAKEPDNSIRAFRDDVFESGEDGQAAGGCALAAASTAASFYRCRTTRRKAQPAAGISPERRASPGDRRSTRPTAPSKLQPSCENCTQTTRSPQTGISSLTAGSASAARTPGLY